jgi:hypothetical protein
MTDLHASVTIDERYAGPPSSANGGYTSGLLAEHVIDARRGPVTVTLRKPPPLDTPMSVITPPSETDDAPTELRDGDVLVADARPGAFGGDAVQAVSWETAVVAQASYRGLVVHPFPTCFTCGPARADGDGLRLAPGLHAVGRIACTWTPHPSLASDAGTVPPRIVWAALDCPGGWTSDLDARPLVLGRMTAQTQAAVAVGRPYVIVARLVGEDGRKTSTASTMYDEDGRVVARAEHVWIAIDPSRFG